MIKKLSNFFVLFLIILGISFSNIPFYALTALIDSYEKTSGIVDKIWLVQQENNLDVVDKFASLRSISEKLRVMEALAAAPTLANQGTIAAVTTGNLTVTLPTHAADDILIVTVSAWVPNTTTGTNTIAAPSGWTKLLNDTVITSSIIDGEWAIFWKRAASSSETNPVFTRPTGWDTGTDTNWSGRAYRISGAITTGDPWDAAVKTALYSTANQAVAAVTVSGTERMVIHFLSYSDDATLTGQPTSTVWTTGTLVETTTGTDGAFNTLRQDNISASTGADATSIAAPAQGRYIYFGISFKPPVPPAGPDATSYTNGTETALNFSACGTTGCGARITTGTDQTITVTGTAFGTVSAGSRANCAGGAGTGCVRIADYTVPDANVIAWADTSIQFRVPSAVTVFGGFGTNCGGVGTTGMCVTAAGVDDAGGALEFWVFPDITSISPSGAGEGREGASVTITGNRFNTSAATGTVDFLNCAGTNAATITSWGDTSIAVTVPSTITDTDDACDVRVTRAAGTGGSKTDTSTGFVVLPDVTGMAAIGTNAAREHASGVDTDGVVQLNGNHLGTATGTVQFTGTFGSISATIHTPAEGNCSVSGWATAGTSACIEVSTSISDSVATGTITLTRSGDSKTDTIDFRVLPRITSNAPTSGVVGDVIQILGNHFCQTGTCPVSPNRSTVSDNVKFGSTTSTESDFVNQTGGAGACNGAGAAWTQTEICVKVPAGTPVGAASTTVTSNTSYTSNQKTFTVASTIPNAPTTLQQFKSDGITEITPVGSGTNGTTVKLEGDISAGTSITMKLDVEVVSTSTGFTGAVTASSTSQTGTSFANVQVTVSGLTNGIQYHWRARTRNASTSETSAWVAFGSNPSGDGTTDGSPANIDFFVDTAAPAISATAASSITDVSATITWTTDENSDTQVAYGTSCPTGQADAAATFSALTNKQPSSPSGSVTSHSVALSGLSASTAYYYMVRSADSVGNVSYDPSTANTCKTFTTSAAVTRIMKTIDIFIQQATSTTITAAFPASFDVFLAESNTNRDNITIRSAFVEVWGISRVSSGNITVNVDFQSGLTPTGTTTYAIDPSGSTAPIFWNVIKSATGLNWDCSGCTDVSNTLGVTLSGTGITSSLVGARLYVTYNYVPQ